MEAGADRRNQVKTLVVHMTPLSPDDYRTFSKGGKEHEIVYRLSGKERVLN